MLSRRSFALGLPLGILATSPLLARAEEEGISATATKTHVEFTRGGKLLTRYVVDPKAAKPYFWPLNVAGTSVTRPWPMEKAPGEATDHPHQKSAWFCHGDVIPEGLKFKKYFRDVDGIDFWSERTGHGKMVCVRVETPVVTKTAASVKTTNEWKTAEDQPVLDESRTITLMMTGKESYLIVLDLDLHAKYQAITFGDTKEGSMGVRVRESLRVDKGKGKLVNADGKNGEKVIWGRLSDWCDYSGPVDAKGTVAGIAVFADPKNASKSAWHARNYGLLAANPFGRGGPHSKFPDRLGQKDLVKIKKGEHLKMRFGLFVHPGDAKGGKVAEAYQTFVATR